MIKGILTILLLLISSVIFGQGFSYSYVDPCTKKLNTVTIPSGQSTVTISYLGQSRTFTKTELEDGAFNSWLYTIQQSSSEPCGDFKKNTQTTQNTIITTNIISTLTSVTAVSTMTVASTIGGISSQGAGNALSNSVNNSSENSSGDNKSSKKGKNGGNTNNPKNSNNGTSQEGGNNTSTNQTNQPSVGQPGSNPPSENTGNSGSNTGNSNGGNTGNTGENGGNTGNSGSNTGNSSGSGGNSGNTGGSGGNSSGSGGNSGNTGGSGGNSGGSGGGNNTSEPKNDPTTTPKDDKSGGNGGTTNSVANAASASSGKSSGGSKVRVGSIIGTGDIVAIRSNEDNSNQFKATMSITKSNTDNTKAKGALLNFTTAVNNSNLTFYGAFTNKNKSNTLIFANSSMVDFNYDLFNTTTVMESHRWGKLSLMGGANFTIGSLAKETFTNVSAVGGGFYLFKVGKNVTGNMLLLAVYSPFTKFYEGSWWESGTLLVPFSSWDYSISKTFKFNVSFSGTWEVNKTMLQYQILTGGKILL
jgi:hypothetical protein